MARSCKRKPIIEESEEDEGRATASTSSDDEDANADFVLKIASRAELSRWDNQQVAAPGNGDSVISSEAGEWASSGTRKKKKNNKKLKKQKVVKGEAPGLIEERIDVIEKSENADVAAETSELANVEPENTVLRSLLRGPRYFDPPERGWTTCFNCGEDGHIAVHCTSAPKKKKPCFVCGSFDHQARKCPAGLDCFICKQPGHRAKDCQEKWNLLLADLNICLKCGESGHDMLICRNDYPPEDLQFIQCYVCKKFGHLCCGQYEDKYKGSISCYLCGASGHDGTACNMYNDDDVIDTPKVRKSKKSLSSKSAPHMLDRTRDKKKISREKGGDSTPKRSKKRGGWIVQDPGETYSANSRRRKVKSPSTWSPYFKRDYNYETPHRGLEHRYSSSSRKYSYGVDGYHDSYPVLSYESPPTSRYSRKEKKNGQSRHSYNRSKRESAYPYDYHEHSNGIYGSPRVNSHHSTFHRSSKGFRKSPQLWTR